MSKPKRTYIYRIIHRDNLEIVLRDKKIYAPNFGKDKNYIPIGETELIKQRSALAIPKSPGGTIEDYISFYFCVRSPMLYCIKHGFDVNQRPQNEIIYLVSSIEKLVELNKKFVFTDGHAYAAFTYFSSGINKINQLDWEVIKSNRCNNTESDSDRKRRKQAECFVHKYIELKAIHSIGVYNQECYDYIRGALKNYNSEIPVKIIPEWYY